MGRKPYVFISYSSEDVNEANGVKDALNQNGIECWIANKSIDGGSDYTSSIPEAIAQCSALVLVWSGNAQKSYWVKSEILEAINRNKVVIPFIIDDFKLNKEFNFMLSLQHRIYAYLNKEAAYKALVNSVNGQLYPGKYDKSEKPVTPVYKPPTPTPAQSPKVVAVKSKINAIPTVLCWIVAFIGTIIAAVLTRFESSEPPILPSMLLFFSMIMLVFTLILLLFERKHKTASVKEINTARMKTAVIYIITIIIMVMTNMLGIFRIIANNAIDACGIIMFFLGIAYFIISFAVCVKFKRTKYVVQ